MIKTGRFCQKCKRKLEDSFGKMYQPKQAPAPAKKKTTTDARMRFLDK